MTEEVLVINEPKKNLIVVDQSESIVAVVNIGTQGPAGESGDLHFVYSQGSASKEWEIEHSLNKYPSVSVQDSAGEWVDGSVEYINKNKVKAIFSAAFSGTAYLN